MYSSKIRAYKFFTASRPSVRILRRVTPRIVRQFSNATPGYATSRNRHLAAAAIAAAVATGLCSGLIENTTEKDMSKKSISPDEVAKHNKKTDCWVVIKGYVYDLSDFIPAHPGGPAVISANAGKDVTAMFEPIHAPDVINKYIAPDKKLGPLDGKMPESLVCPPFAPGESYEDLAAKEELRTRLPPLENITNAYDFEHLASKVLTNQAWAYYSSGADDEVTMRENHSAYHRIFFKPRVLVGVKDIDTSTEMLNTKVDLPFYVSATALCKLGNPQEGEKDIARGCGSGPKKIPQMVSTMASCSLEETIDAAKAKDQVQWFQLYVNSDRKITDELISRAEKLGFKALFVTVDAPSLGNREKDAKVKFSSKDHGPKEMHNSDAADVSSGASRALSSFIDPSLSWDDIIEFKKKTKMPIIIKGVQRVEDVIKAADIGVAGVVLSNHGGRQLDFSCSPLEVLAEAAPIIKARKSDKKFELYVDGGVRRGTDILKALCLGASGVGLGRPFLYANSTYGEAGVRKLIEKLNFEIVLSMRSLGVTKISDLNPEMLDLSALKNKSVAVPTDYLYDSAYEKGTLSEFQPPSPSK